jgi:hypothetical protein
MLYLEDFEYKENKLCIFTLGGSITGCNIEMHDVVFLVVKNSIEAAEKIRKKWLGTQKSLHIDSWFTVENIDGYNVEITKTNNEDHVHNLYFVNLGYYKKGFFGESHFMTLVVGNSKADAVDKAKQKLILETEMLHSDNIYDLDDCIKIQEVDNYYIKLRYTGLPSTLMPTNGYQKLKNLEFI